MCPKCIKMPELNYAGQKIDSDPKCDLDLEPYLWGYFSFAFFKYRFYVSVRKISNLRHLSLNQNQ